MASLTEPAKTLDQKGGQRHPADLWRTLGGQRSNELQSEAEAVARPHDGGHARGGGHVEFNFQQVARVEQNSRVQNHSALTDLSPATLDHRGRKTFGREYLDREVDRHSLPAACWAGTRHSVVTIFFFRLRRCKLRK